MVECAWSPFELAHMPDALKHGDGVTWQSAWLNDTYQVLFRVTAPREGVPPMGHLSIRRIDREPVHDWRDIQRIKNELCGIEA